MSELGFEVRLRQPYEEGLELVTQALKMEGFGVLTHIDVRATLQEKLGVAFRPYAILGACNPPLAHQALLTDGEAGLLLPCNVTVEASETGGALVRITNPESLLLTGGFREIAALREVALEARARLERVAQWLASTD